MIQFVIGHWPFVLFTLISAVSMQTAKISVWTKARISNSKLKSFFWWGRKTLPLHPVLIGTLVGLVPGIPISDGMGETLATKCLYFAGAGVLSTWVFDLLKALAKKYGLELGDSNGATENSICDCDKTPIEIPIKIEISGDDE
jgi:hypothetical protein